MSMDYGHRKKRRMSSGMKMALVGGIVICLAIAGYFGSASFLNDRAHNIDDAKAYNAEGPPCPVVTHADLAANGPALRHNFDFDDIHLAYAFGETDCAMVADHGGLGLAKYPICHFTSAGSLEVTVGKTDAIFRPGLGKPAAIIYRKGQVSCVLTPKEKD
jgi:hypothetical protein